jgi:Uma2 family endonuclease
MATAVLESRNKASTRPGRGKEKNRQVVLHDVSWEQYIAIGNALADRPGLRLTYDHGSLEIMVVSFEHEKFKKRFGWLVETLMEELEIPFESGGSMTFQKAELERGFEPDECYWIKHEKQMRGRIQYDPNLDPSPDLQLEVEISRSALNRMAMFAAYGVPEVWRFDGGRIRVCLRQADGNYKEFPESPAFPGIPIAELAQFLQPNPNVDNLTANREFRKWVRQHKQKRRKKK